MVKMFWEKVAKILHSGAFQIIEIQNFNQTMVMIFQECVGCTAMYWEFNDSCTAKYTFICLYWNFLWKQSGLNHIVHKCFVDRDENVLLIYISENIKCSSSFYVNCLIPYLKKKYWLEVGKSGLLSRQILPQTHPHPPWETGLATPLLRLEEIKRKCTQF
jgi:hypothetical protein